MPGREVMNVWFPVGESRVKQGMRQGRGAR